MDPNYYYYISIIYHKRKFIMAEKLNDLVVTTKLKEAIDASIRFNGYIADMRRYVIDTARVRSRTESGMITKVASARRVGRFEYAGQSELGIHPLAAVVSRLSLDLLRQYQEFVIAYRYVPFSEKFLEADVNTFLYDILLATNNLLDIVESACNVNFKRKKFASVAPAGTSDISFKDMKFAPVGASLLVDVGVDLRWLQDRICRSITRLHQHVDTRFVLHSTHHDTTDWDGIIADKINAAAGDEFKLKTRDEIAKLLPGEENDARDTLAQIRRLTSDRNIIDQICHLLGIDQDDNGKDDRNDPPVAATIEEV